MNTQFFGAPYRAGCVLWKLVNLALRKEEKNEQIEKNLVLLYQFRFKSGKTAVIKNDKLLAVSLTAHYFPRHAPFVSGTVLATTLQLLALFTRSYSAKTAIFLIKIGSTGCAPSVLFPRISP